MNLITSQDITVLHKTKLEKSFLALKKIKKLQGNYQH